MTLGRCPLSIFCSRGTPPRKVPRVCGPSTRKPRSPNGMAARAEQPPPEFPPRIPGKSRLESMQLYQLVHPHGGVRPFDQKSTCLTRLNLRPYVVQMWSRYIPESGRSETLVVHRVAPVSCAEEGALLVLNIYHQSRFHSSPSIALPPNSMHRASTRQGVTGDSPPSGPCLLCHAWPPVHPR